MMTKPMIRYLLPLGPTPPKRKNSMVNMDTPSPKSITVPFLGDTQQDSEADLDSNENHPPSSIRALLTTPTHTVHRLWRKFDDAIMRPVFGGRGFVHVVPSSPTQSNGHQQQQQQWD